MKQHIKLTHNYLHTKLAAPIDNAHRTLIWRELTTPQHTHSSPLSNILEKDTLLRKHFTRIKTLSPFPVPPWAPQITNVANLQLTKEQAKVEVTKQLKTKLDTNTLVFFANGSLILGRGGGAAAILTNTQTAKMTYVRKDSIITNFETELMALLLCQELLAKHITIYDPPQPSQFSQTAKQPSRASPYQRRRLLDNT
ncbi:hypothetical protein O181_055756 [Austropuccinia psidii MF-1]|uniref:RNase H type-1 domain-containing protein n=1 Tax=Austropuccinia psidii MF-1 TaxID=1389203 RepID=A0A9Q3HSB9_9BASI|nr:hypothetical protein [Austropuccinia psidii MF-1]